MQHISFWCSCISGRVKLDNHAGTLKVWSLSDSKLSQNSLCLPSTPCNILSDSQFYYNCLSNLQRSFTWHEGKSSCSASLPRIGYCSHVKSKNPFLSHCLHIFLTSRPQISSLVPGYFGLQSLYHRRVGRPRQAFISIACHPKRIVRKLLLL